MKLKLGLDTGGTFTDAVIIDEQAKVLSSAKALTTHSNLSLGLHSAISQVLQSADDLRFADNIVLVSLSTTLATNAIVEGKGRTVASMLVGYSEIQLKRAGLATALQGNPVGFFSGGHDAAGDPLNPLDETTVTDYIAQHKNSVDAFAVSSIFAVRNPEHEKRVKELIEQQSTKPVSCGFELSSSLDAPRRALTAVLNARLIPMITQLLKATQKTLRELGVQAPLMIVKGDGSLVSAQFAMQSPVETILSGPAASVVGAQFLSGEKELIVADMGGTTTDIAVLHAGLPKLDPDGATVGGWRTMVKAVAINAHGLGGDSAISFNREIRDFVVGPQRLHSISLLAHHNPMIVEKLQAQVSQEFINTHAAQFALLNNSLSDHATLTVQQRELLRKVEQGPVALVDLFKDQTLDRALSRLIEQGVVIVAGFTPTDACHILGTHSRWNAGAAITAAEILMRYSEANLGPVFRDAGHFAQYIHEKVSRKAATRLLEATLADESNQPNLNLPVQVQRFINDTFTPSSDNAVSIQIKLGTPVMAIGAPVESYYPRVAQLLDTRLLIPDNADVANALGAVVGSVRQSCSLTITPAGGARVRVHTENGPKEFADLEMAVSWCKAHLSQEVAIKARCAGTDDFELEVERNDNCVEEGGQRVFFESVISVHATGRPAIVN